VVAKVRERLVVSKQATYKLYMERFNLKKLNEVEGKEQYRVEISDRFAALENLDTDVDINRAWGTIRQNIKISAKESVGYYDLQKHEPWFDEGRKDVSNWVDNSLNFISISCNTVYDPFKTILEDMLVI
jgi:hypothetical protein